MTATKTAPYTSPLLLPQPQNVVVLPPYPNPNRHLLLRKTCRRILYILSLTLLILISTTYLFYPSNPELSILNLNLENLRFHPRSHKFDLNLNLTLKIRNRDFYTLDYDSLVLEIGYRGQRLGLLNYDCGGKIKPREVSYLNATLQVVGGEVLSDDLGKGVVAFDTAAGIGGRLGVWFVDLPIKTKMSCEVVVNTRKKTIYRQSCYPEVSEVR